MSELLSNREDLENQFQLIQNEYISNIETLKEDPNLLPFIKTYEKVFFSLEKFHAENQKLYKKNVDNSSLYDVDKKAKRAWALLDAGQKKEDAICNKVTQLQEQLDKLSSQLQEERTNNLKKDEHYRELIKDRDRIKENFTQLLDNVKQMEKSSEDMMNRNKTLEDKVDALREKNSDLVNVVSMTDEQMKTKTKIYENLEKELIEIKGRLERRSHEYADLQFSATTSKKKVDELNKDLRDANKKIEIQVIAIEELQQKSHDLNENLSSQRKEMAIITADSTKTAKELNLVKSIERKVAAENSQLLRKLDNEHKVVLKLQQSAHNEKSQNKASQQEIQTLHKELDKMKEAENILHRQKTTLEREMNIYVEKIHRLEHLKKQADEDTCHQEHTILSLEKQSVHRKDQIERLEKTILSIDKLREKQSNDISDKNKSLDTANNEIIIRDAEIEDMKKEINLMICELKDLDQSSSRLRLEKGKIVRELTEEKNVNQNLKKEINVLSLELKSLRNEIFAKDDTLVKTYFEKKNESTRKDQLNNEVAVLRRHINDRDNAIEKQGLEIHNLNTSLKLADECLFAQKKEYDQLINERDILSTQLIRRNDELALLHEQVKIQNNTLKKGEMQYQERVEELRHLKIKVHDLQRELDLIKGGSDNLCFMNKELMQKDKELLYEKVKVKALSEELQNPLNVHRWRKLEGSDPATFELVQKNESLQKRLIKKAEEVIEKVALIQEKDEHIKMLEKQLSRKPGSEFLDKLKLKENEVREKARQMKAMAGELNMNQAQVNEYKKEIHRLNNQLNDLKHKFFDLKKKETIAKEKEFEWLAESGLVSLENAYREGMERLAKRRETNRNSSRQSGYQRVKFVGGGFAVK